MSSKWAHLPSRRPWVNGSTLCYNVLEQPIYAPPRPPRTSLVMRGSVSVRYAAPFALPGTAVIKASLERLEVCSRVNCVPEHISS